MSYPIGDKRFPEIADLYQDVQGKQPREVSEAPVQMVHVVNAFGTDTVLARAYATINPPVAPGTIGPDFTFENGRVFPGPTPTPALSSTMSWRIVRLGCSVATFPVRVGFVPFIDRNNNTVAAGSDAVFNEYAVQPAAYVQHRADWDGFVAPYGGYFWFTGVGGAALVTLRVTVIGSLRQTLS